MDMFTLYNLIKKPKKITDFFMILAWASPFKKCYVCSCKTCKFTFSFLSRFVAAWVSGATTSFYCPDCGIFKRKWRCIDAGGISECSGCNSVYIFVYHTIHHVQIHNMYICCASTSRNQRHDLHKGTHTTRLPENARH